jgi:hypothetical protein
MAKILESLSINGQLQKVVETPLGYIMNGHYYNKNNMIPKPLRLFPVIGNNNDLSMNKKMVLKHSLSNHSKTKGDTVITDRYDPSICYVWTVGERLNSMMLFKIKEANGEASVVNSNTYAGLPTTSPIVRAYVGQDISFVYYLISCAATWREYFVKVDKVSLTMTILEDLGTYCWSSPIKETDTHIYYGRKSGYQTNFIKRYNKTTTAIDILPVAAKTGSIYFSTCYSELLVTSDTNFDMFALYHNTTTSKIGFTRYTFDLNQTTLANICTEAECNITWGTVTQLPMFATTNQHHYEPFITITADNKKYLNIAVYELFTSTAAQIPQYGIYTFLIDPTTKDLTFKSFSNFTTDYYRGLLGTNKNNFLVVATDNSTLFLTFDTVNEKFVVSDTLSNQPNHIGIDQAENIWIVNALNEVDMLAPFVPTNITVNYESSGYKYLGVDINSYITIEAKNYNSANIACNLQLTLKGNAVFTSTGTKVLTDATLATGSKQIPITIKGAGSITVYPQLIM